MSKSYRVRLIHWQASEAADRVRQLTSAGCWVDFETFGPDVLPALKRSPPDAVVIDLSRLPSQGRDLGLLLRKTAATRSLLLVFAGGDPAKVERTRQLLPDACYTSWEGIAQALEQAQPPEDPVVPASVMDAYSGTPLPQKLGIRVETKVSLVDAPSEFRETLGTLPEGAELQDGLEGSPDLIIWFVRSLDELQDRVAKIAKHTGKGGIWIAWPKKASGVASDLTQAVVRKTGLAAGLVDYRICAIDTTWSGLRFTWRS